MSNRCLKSRQQAKPLRTSYNPIGFDPAEVLPLHLHRYADHARFFLHVLYSQRVFKEITDEFVPLKAAYLRRFFPDNMVYKQVRDALLDSETIVCDGICYQADTLAWRDHNDRHRGGKCFGYKIGPRWEDVRHERITLAAKPLFKSITKVNKKRQSEIVLLPHQHIWVPGTPYLGSGDTIPGFRGHQVPGTPYLIPRFQKPTDTHCNAGMNLRRESI